MGFNYKTWSQSFGNSWANTWGTLFVKRRGTGGRPRLKPPEIKPKTPTYNEDETICLLLLS